MALTDPSCARSTSASLLGKDSSEETTSSDTCRVRIPMQSFDFLKLNKGVRRVWMGPSLLSRDPTSLYSTLICYVRSARWVLTDQSISPSCAFLVGFAQSAVASPDVFLWRTVRLR